MGTREIVRECVAVKLISNITVIPLSIDCILRISGTTIGGILGLLAGWVNGPAFNGANYFMLELISCLWGVYHYIAVPEPARKGPVEREPTYHLRNCSGYIFLLASERTMNNEMPSRLYK